MGALTKAVLYKLKDAQPAGKGKPPNVKVDGDPITVQFNPTSLRIQRQNNIDQGGTTTRTQRRQNPSQQSATLTLDLEFDTAEGDSSGAPLDVRNRTALVRQFVEPDRAKPADPPPRVLFLWGTLNFAGIVTSLSEDLDYFSPDGMALRAKLSVTITEQNLAFEAMKQGAGARTDSSATPPGGAPVRQGPGSSGTANPVQAAQAQAGESIQQLLSRLDQDPSGWRTAMNGLSSPLGLTAGAQVQLAASASVSAGVGVSAGFAAGAEASAGAALGAALGIEIGASAGATAGASAGAIAASSAGGSASAAVSGGAFAGASATAAAGFALSAGGGITASYNEVVGAGVSASASAERASFVAPAVVVPAVSASTAVSAGPPAVDVRATGYGTGLPLRPRAELTTATGPAPWQRTASGTSATRG